MTLTSLPGAVTSGPSQPLLPISEILRAPVLPPPFRVTTAGGPTDINLRWASLMESADHLDSARAALEAQHQMACNAQSVLTQNGVALLPLSGKIPALHGRLVALIGAGFATGYLVNGLSAGAHAAHQAYRNTEDTVLRWLHALTLAADHEIVLANLLHPDGDKTYAYDWSVTLGTLGAGGAVDVIKRRFPAAAAMVGVAQLISSEAELVSYAMSSVELNLTPDPAHHFDYMADGSLGSYMEQMGQVSEHGDIAVSRLQAEGQEVALVHLPGFDIHADDGGRSTLGVTDALGNNSEHLAPLVEDALERSGVPEGTPLLLTGFSLGGLHALNLSSKDSLSGKYSIKGVLTVGSPGRNTPMPAEFPIIHLQNAHDPVPHILGQVHQGAANRMTVQTNHTNQDISGTVAGSGHNWELNVEAVHRLEQPEVERETLSQQEQELVQELRQYLHGSAHAEVYSTQWAAVPGQDRSAFTEIRDGLERHLQESLEQALDPSTPSAGPVPSPDTGAYQEPVQQGRDNGHHDSAQDSGPEAVHLEGGPWQNAGQPAGQQQHQRIDDDGEQAQGQAGDRQGQ